MTQNLFQPISHRVKFWLLVCAIAIVISQLTRVILLSNAWADLNVSPVVIIGIFSIGGFYDVINALYMSIPLALYLWLVPTRLYNKSWHQFLLGGLLFIFVSLLLFNAVAELLFWDEFSSRFNFIAVDYLVYTTEVVGNITQSYPLELILTAILMVATAIVYLLRAAVRSSDTNISFKKRSAFLLVLVAILTVVFFGVQTTYHQFSKNVIANELAGNGLYELFAAYRNNELDYDRFYQGIDENEALEMVYQMMQTKDVSTAGMQLPGVERQITNVGPERKLNVVLISVESFSADFMGTFGNTKNITPFLDSLSQHSLLFTNLYATGTRTVRGLEALSLCVPPTPGQSIVRRPKNEHLFSLAKVFHDKGYRCEYIFGGYSYFDNMKYFFSNNEYEVVDRTALEDDDVHYENIWGVADEDLFTLAEHQFDRPKREPFFAHIMTTSNHRPFTYPEGRIDIPSHSGRDGAVKYTDYAIGKFIRQASTKDWFQNTIFIIVADHCASSAGKTELPVDKYHIPMLVYSPGNVAPGTMNRLMSQIDIGPTLLGMLNFSYESKFFGYDMFKLEPGRERAFISTYQNLGYLKDGKLVILSPRRQVSSFLLTENSESMLPTIDDKLIKEAIAWYQTASYSFKHGLMKGSSERGLTYESTHY